MLIWRSTYNIYLSLSVFIYQSVTPMSVFAFTRRCALSLVRRVRTSPTSQVPTHDDCGKAGRPLPPALFQQTCCCSTDREDIDLICDYIFDNYYFHTNFIVLIIFNVIYFHFNEVTLLIMKSLYLCLILFVLILFYLIFICVHLIGFFTFAYSF